MFSAPKKKRIKLSPQTSLSSSKSKKPKKKNNKKNLNKI